MGLEAASFLNDLNVANPAGSDGKSQGDDHLRLLKTVLKATFPGMTAAYLFDVTTTSNTIQVVSTDAGAGAEPVIDLYRNSASPANNDELGRITFYGKDDAGNKTEVANIHAAWLDVANGSEDAEVVVDMIIAGAVTRFLGMRVDFTGFGPNSAEVYFLGRNDSDGYLSLQGGNAVGDGALRVFGNTHATKAKDIQFLSNNVQVYQYDFSGGFHEFDGLVYQANDVRMGQNTTASPGNGNNAQGFGFIASVGQVNMNVNNTAHFIGRCQDGAVVGITVGGTAQGIISISGATCT